MEQQEWSKHENDDDRELVDRGPLSDKEPTPFTPEMRWRFFDHQTWKYKNQRELEYPKLSDQLDMLWHAMNDTPSLRIEPFYSVIKEIKDKYPKP